MYQEIRSPKQIVDWALYVKIPSTLVFVFYDHARAPSDVYWYSLVDHSPGWHSVYGTQGQPDTWRMVLDNTDVTSVYTYSSLSIGDCNVPEGFGT